MVFSIIISGFFKCLKRKINSERERERETEREREREIVL